MYIINEIEDNEKEKKMKEFIMTNYINEKFTVREISHKRAYPSIAYPDTVIAATNFDYNFIYLEYLKKNKMINNFIISGKYFEFFGLNEILKDRKYEKVNISDNKRIYYNPLRYIKDEKDIINFTKIFCKSENIEECFDIFRIIFLYAYKNKKMKDIKILFNYIYSFYKSRVIKEDVLNKLEDISNYKFNDENILLLNGIVLKEIEKLASYFNSFKILNKVNPKKVNKDIICMYYEKNFVLELYLFELKKINTKLFCADFKREEVSYCAAYFLIKGNKEKANDYTIKELTNRRICGNRISGYFEHDQFCKNFSQELPLNIIYKKMCEVEERMLNENK